MLLNYSMNCFDIKYKVLGLLLVWIYEATLFDL